MHLFVTLINVISWKTGIKAQMQCVKERTGDEEGRLCQEKEKLFDFLKNI